MWELTWEKNDDVDDILAVVVVQIEEDNEREITNHCEVEGSNRETTKVDQPANRGKLNWQLPGSFGGGGGKAATERR